MVRIITGIGLLIALAVASEGERVRGTGYSRTSHPVVIDDPDEGFLEDADETEDAGPVTYRGTIHYELRQGNRLDGKFKHRETDYIAWTAQGATLKAEGRCHDGDPAEATRLSSNAWGSQKVEARITREEGESGSLTAENRIGFQYTYNVEGSKVLEATVQLNGNCVDIKGGSHRFALSDTRSEAVGESFRDVRVRGVKVGFGGRVAAATTRDDAGISSESSSNVEFAADDTIDMTVTREFGQAGGDSGGVSGPVIEDQVSGETPLEKTWDVYSAGTVVLTARGDKASGPGGTTYVFLEDFTIENVLRVYKIVVSPTPDSGGGPEGGAPGGGPGTTTPGDSGGSGGGGGAGEMRGSMNLDGLPWLDGLRVGIHVIAPFGLIGEPGGMPGEVRLTLNTPAPRELVFSVRMTPDGALSLPRDETITIREGEIAGGGPLVDARTFEGIEPEAIVSLHLLAEDGSLTGREVAVTVPLVSTTSRSEPQLYACADCDAWIAGADAVVTGIRGRRAPDLLVGRLGFDGYAGESTTVSIAVSDPDGVLAPLPASLLLTPDASEASVPLQLNDVDGIAVLTLRAGEESLKVHVVSRTQGWSSLPAIRVPLGATAAVSYRMTWPENDPRTVTASVEGGAQAQVVPGTEIDALSPGALLWATRVRGDAIGSTTIRLESDGLPPLTVPIEVVPARVEFAGGCLRLANLPVGCEGTIRLVAPAGIRFESLAIPAELTDVVTVDGLGNEQLVLTLRASPNLPASLAMPVALSGETERALVFDVDERLSEDAPLPSRNNYQVGWK
ncbi:MAG: hypothetical protein ACYTHK_10170 [Planctomycetota bacterium]